MDIEGVDDPQEAQRILAALSENTVGMTILFDGRPVTYMKHVTTNVMRAHLFTNFAPPSGYKCPHCLKMRPLHEPVCACPGAVDARHRNPNA
jgi:hypothetical protein